MKRFYTQYKSIKRRIIITAAAISLLIFTFNPAAGDTLLLNEDFEDNQIQGWNYSPADWQIITDTAKGSHVWTTAGSGTNFASAGTAAWSDYRFTLQVQCVSGDADIYFRRIAPDSFALRLESKRIVLWSEQNGKTRELSSVSLAPGTTWHDYSIEAVGKLITISVDGNVVVTYTDKNSALLTGMIGLEATGSKSVHFDNIQVTGLGETLNAWIQTNGPAGGMIHTVEIHPTDPDIIFIGGMAGVYKSENGGAIWKALPSFAPLNEEVSTLLINPNKSQVMYALIAQTGKLHMTADGGQSWPPLFANEWVSCIALNPVQPDELLAGLEGGSVRHSTNGGINWKDVTGNLPGYWINCLSFGKKNELWAGTAIKNGVGNGMLYHSVNNGKDWSSVNVGQAVSSHIHTLFADPENRDILYVGLMDINNHKFNFETDIYLVKLSNNGKNCTCLRLPFTDAMINIMGRAPHDKTLYTGTGGRLFGSSDEGRKWTEISLPGFNGDIKDIAVDPRNTDTIYLPRRANGIMKSTNRGVIWTPMNKGLVNTSPCLLAAADPSGSTIYAAGGSNGDGTFKTTNFGSSWINVSDNGITHPWGDELVVSPFNPQTITEVVDVGKFFVTNNGGSSWKETINPRREGSGFRAGTIQATMIAPSDPQVIYTCKSGFGLYKSTNSGQFWDFLHQSGVDYTYSLAVHPSNPKIILSGYNPKPFQDWAVVQRSTDGGTTWSPVLKVPHSSGITSVTFDSRNPDTLYAGSTGLSSGGGGQIYHSIDGGAGWKALNPHFTMLTVWGQPQLTGDSSSPMTAYAGTWLGGTWKTSDAGQNWTLLKQAPLSSTALSIDPLNSRMIYAADRTAPIVWKSIDAGNTWNRIADFRSKGAFLVNRVLAASNAVFASTFGPGLHDGKLFSSKDEGTTWNDITNGLPRSVLDITVAPSQPKVIYVTTHIYGAYKSIDGGTTWNPLGNFPSIGAYDIEVDPVVADTVYAAGLGAGSVPTWVLQGGYTFKDDAGVYKSVNGGLKWSNILRTKNECRAIRIHPDNHNVLFASALSDGFFVSTNGGGSWTKANTGLDSLNLTSAWVAGTKVYAGTQGSGVYAGDVNITTGAVTWAAGRSNKPIPDVHNIQIQVDPSNSSRIYVGANPGGLFRSDDGGKTWYDKNFLTPSVMVDDPKRQGYYTFAINPANPLEVWVGTWGKGIYKSYDGQDYNIGAHGGSNSSMIGKHINTLLFHPTLGILAASEEGVFYTGNGGAAWNDWSTGLGTLQVRTLALFPDGTVLGGTAGYELYVRKPSDPGWSQLPGTDNFGTFWPIWNDRPLYQYSTLLYHPANPAIVYFGTFPAGVYKSLDNGVSWREQNTGWLNDGVFAISFHPKDTTILYAGTYNGVSRSLDGGAHWQRWDKGWPGEQWVFSLAFDPKDPLVMYACSKNGENEGTGSPEFHGMVMKSDNGGENWYPITKGLDIMNEFYKIIIDKFDPGILFLATQHDGVYISYNSGKSWQPWNDGLFNPSAATNGNNVTNTMILSEDGIYLYFGSAGSGVFRRSTLLLKRSSK